MIVTIVTILTDDGLHHTFKSSDTADTLQHYKYDIERHALLVEAGGGQYCFPMEHIIVSKVYKRDM